MGMQQHEYPSHSRHLVFPPVASAGLTMLSVMDDAALPGPFLLTSEPLVPQAMSVLLVDCSVNAGGDTWTNLYTWGENAKVQVEC